MNDFNDCMIDDHDKQFHLFFFIQKTLKNSILINKISFFFLFSKIRFKFIFSKFFKRLVKFCFKTNIIF